MFRMVAHFQEEFENGRMSFDYRVRDGVATMSNGLALMRSIGLEVWFWLF
jgi:DNA mismatch repair ATPase MutS